MSPSFGTSSVLRKDYGYALSSAEVGASCHEPACNMRSCNCRMLHHYMQKLVTHVWMLSLAHWVSDTFDAGPDGVPAHPPPLTLP